MSRHGEITVAWADGEHQFRLAIGQLRELQEKTDAGPVLIERRLAEGTWRVDDIRETIRLGLIGGGMVPAAALKLVRTYVEERPLLESVPVARAILLAVLIGADDEPQPGKAAAAEAPNESVESSPSPPSMAPAVH